MRHVYIIMVNDDTPCGIWTSQTECDKEFDSLLKEVPKENFIRMIEIEKNIRFVGMIRKGKEIRNEEGLLKLT